MKPKSNSTHICTKCQRPLEEGGGCYTFCNGKNFLPITTMKIKATALSNSTPKEWVLLPTIVITSESPFYIIISWLRWYIEFDFFPTYKSK